MLIHGGWIMSCERAAEYVFVNALTVDVLIPWGVPDEEIYGKLSAHMEHVKGAWIAYRNHGTEVSALRARRGPGRNDIILKTFAFENVDECALFKIKFEYRK